MLLATMTLSTTKLGITGTQHNGLKYDVQRKTKNKDAQRKLHLV
jgi:hypothetical protein